MPWAPPADAAERARTVAGRSSAALCVRALEAGRPLAHATTTTGTTWVLVPTGGEVDAALAGRDDLTAVLLVSDRAPVPLRDPLRAQVWLRGWLTPVHPATRRAAVLAFAETRPVGPLLDVGRGATLLRLDVAGDLGPRDVVRPLGIDRLGFRLRIERPTGHRDLRVPFPRPLTCPGRLQAATRQLLCAARAR